MDVRFKKALEIIKEYIPDAVISSADLQESCGCYSEYTTESAQLRIVVECDTHWKQGELASDDRETLTNKLHDWAATQFQFTGCTCCCENETEHKDSECNCFYLSLYVTKR